MAIKIKNSWWVVIFLLLLAACLFPLIVLSNKNAFTLTIAWQAVLIFLVSVTCQLVSGHAIRELTGKFNLQWCRELLTGLTIGGLLMLLPAIFLLAIGVIQWHPGAVTASTIISGLTVFGAVAIAEELLFRGFMFQRLIKAFGQWPAQLIIGGLFLLTHINNPGMSGSTKLLASINIFTASILFGLAYINTQSLAMPIGIHFMANFMQGTILGFGVSGGKEPSLLSPVQNHAPVWLTGGDFGLEASLPGLIFLLFLTYQFYKWRKKAHSAP